MKELEFLKIIKKTLTRNSHIGDDCAYLQELGLVITQDSLVEDIHFSPEFSTPYQLAYKAIMVNLSDIFASGATPAYLTISLSLPNNINTDFISEFYKACNYLAEKFDFEIIGGDITGSNKIFISVCAIGLTKERKIASRKNAKTDDFIITTGVHGSSAAGLYLLKNNNPNYPQIVQKHLLTDANNSLSNEISSKCSSKYAMMDTSDGLIDALFKIAKASDVLLSVDFDKIPYDKEIETIAQDANIDFKDWIFYGGEDYKLLACIDETNLLKLDKSLYTIIGRVKQKTNNNFVEINFKDNILEINNLKKTYNHFKKD